MNFKKILGLLIFASAMNFAFAQDRRVITLKEAVDLSIKNNKNLQISQALIEEAVADVRSAKDRQLPDVAATASYLRLGSAKVDLKNAGNGSSNGAPKASQALYGIVNLSLPLYAGGRIRYGIESAGYLETAARLNADNDRENVIYNTIAAYTNFYKASRASDVIKENLNAAVQRDSLFARLERNGLLARNDLLKSQLQTSNIELTLLDAQNNFSVSRAMMNLMLGLPENTLLLPDSSFVSISSSLKALPDIEAEAFQNRKDFQSAGYRIKAADVAVKSAKSLAYPTLALTGGYVAADIPKVLTITNAVNVGVGVQYNLSSLWKNNTTLRQAKAKQAQAVAAQALLDDGIRIEVTRDYSNYILAQKKIEVYEKAIMQAQENYRITKNKYDNSLVTITELLDADVLLLQARLNAAYAKADVSLAYNKLLQTTGTISQQ